MGNGRDHVAGLLALPAQERARLARVLLESLDEDSEDVDAEEAQLAELTRRMKALEDGSVELIDNAKARARVMARLRAIRGQ